MCFAEVSVCGRRRSGVEGLMKGGGVAEIGGCGEREEETTHEELQCGGDDAFGGAQGVKEREMFNHHDEVTPRFFPKWLAAQITKYDSSGVCVFPFSFSLIWILAGFKSIQRE